MEEMKYQASDYKSDQYVRWCPGCGDHAFLNSFHKLWPNWEYLPMKLR